MGESNLISWDILCRDQRLSTFLRSFLLSSNEEVVLELFLFLEDFHRSGVGNKQAISHFWAIFKERFSFKRLHPFVQVSEEYYSLSDSEISLNSFMNLYIDVSYLLSTRIYSSFISSTFYLDLVENVRTWRTLSVKECFQTTPSKFLLTFIKQNCASEADNFLMLEKIENVFNKKLSIYFNKHSPKKLNHKLVLESSDVNDTEKHPEDYVYDFGGSPAKRRLSSLEKTQKSVHDIIEEAELIISDFLSSESRGASVVSAGVRSYICVTLDKIKEEFAALKPRKSYLNSLTTSKSKLKLGASFDHVHNQLSHLFLLPHNELAKWLEFTILPEFYRSSAFVEMVVFEDSDIRSLRSGNSEISRINLKSEDVCETWSYSSHLFRSSVFNYDPFSMKNVGLIENLKLRVEDGEITRVGSHVGFCSVTLLPETFSQYRRKVVDALFPNGLDILDVTCDEPDIGLEGIESLSQYISSLSSDEDSAIVRVPNYHSLVSLEKLRAYATESSTFFWPHPVSHLHENFINYLSPSLCFDVRVKYVPLKVCCDAVLKKKNIQVVTVSLMRTLQHSFGIRFTLTNSGFMLVTGFSVDPQDNSNNSSPLNPDLSKIELEDMLVSIKLGSLQNLAGKSFEEIISLVKTVAEGTTLEFTFLRNWKKFFYPCNKCFQVLCHPRKFLVPEVEATLIPTIFALFTAEIKQMFSVFALSEILFICENLLLCRNFIFLSDSETKLSAVFYFFEALLKLFSCFRDYSHFSALFSSVDIFNLPMLLQNKKGVKTAFCIGCCTKNLETIVEAAIPVEKFISCFDSLKGEEEKKIDKEEWTINNVFGYGKERFSSVCLVDCDFGIIIDTDNVLGDSLARSKRQAVGMSQMQKRLFLKSYFSPPLPAALEYRFLEQWENIKERIARETELDGIVNSMAVSFFKVLKTELLPNINLYFYADAEFIYFHRKEFLSSIQVYFAQDSAQVYEFLRKFTETTGFFNVLKNSVRSNISPK